jgi:hypothetical protein
VAGVGINRQEKRTQDWHRGAVPLLPANQGGKVSEFKTMPIWEIEIEAMSRDCKVVIAEPNQLQFDIEDDESRTRFAIFYLDKLFYRYGDKLPRQHWKSRSGNDHWVITLPYALSVEERITMQAIGGSDPGREWAAMCCHWDGSHHPILLYKPNPKLLTSGTHS